jgi:hypothetical protein
MEDCMTKYEALQKLQEIINDQWPDISVGYSQRIMLYHDQGTRTPEVHNILDVIQYVFSHPEEDIMAAARRLHHGIQQSLDGTVLGGMAVYNAGSDRRNDPTWMAVWAGNIASYERCLREAESFVVVGPNQDAALRSLDALWGLAEAVGHLSPQREDEAKTWIVTVKDFILK